MNKAINELKEQCILRMRESMERIEKCLAQISETEVWQRPNSQLSSVGNLVLHLCGNIKQYAKASLGNVPDSRERQKEFDAVGGYSCKELSDKIVSTISEAITTIINASNEAMMQERIVQGFNMTGIGICIHVTEHLSYHTGQIAMHTKLLRDQDLGFYAGMNLDVTNPSYNGVGKD